MAAKDTAKNVIQFFAESVDWETSDRQKLKQAATGWKYFGLSGWAIAAIAIAAVIPLTALHEYVPVVATVDKQTGTTEVRVGKQRLDMDDPKNERIMIADLGRYVKAREGFTRGEAENNYQTVFYMSEESLRGAWDAEYKPELNKQALLNILTAKDQIKLVNISVQFLPSDKPELKVAQVRYDKEKRIGSNPPTTQRFVSTFTFTYDTKYIPRTVEGIILNPHGFAALNYRKDKETEEREIPSQQAMAAGIYANGGR